VRTLRAAIGFHCIRTLVKPWTVKHRPIATNGAYMEMTGYEKDRFHNNYAMRRFKTRLNLKKKLFTAAKLNKSVTNPLISNGRFPGDVNESLG